MKTTFPAPTFDPQRRFLHAVWCLGVVILLPSFVQSVTAADKLNVLVIIADDLNTALNCYGHELVQSSHIDRLAARGVRFDRAYCQYPLCNPTRASFLSGMYPDATLVFDNGTHFRKAVPNVVTLPELFRQQGYATAGVGKVFHDGVPKGTAGLDDPQSWDQSVNPHGREHDDIGKIQSLIPGKVGGTLSWLADDGEPDELTDSLRATTAIQWLEEHHDRPFFLAVGLYRPHTPYVAPRSYFDLYPLEQVRLPKRPFADRDDIPLAALPDKPEQLGMTDDQRRKAIRAYYAATSFMDAQVGRLIDAVDRLGLTQRTAIVFLSDHGYHLGEHGLWQKRSLYEESARVPLIIAAPQLGSQGAASQALVELVDLYPTLVELCGLPQPKHLQGRSLKPLLGNPKARFRTEALTQVVCATSSLARAGAPQGYSIRTERYRYTEWNGGREGVELFDHTTDPFEQTNRAFDPACAETLRRLSRRLAQRVYNDEGAEAHNTGIETAYENFHIITLGDSITKGVRPEVQANQTYASLLEQSLSCLGLQTKVTNVGIGGERTDQALQRLGREVISRQPDLVTIMYGTNDSYVDHGQNASRLSTAKYRANLRKLVAELRAAAITPVLMTAPRFGDAHRLNGAGEHPNVRLEKYVRHCRQAARDLDVPLVDHLEHWTRQNAAGIDVGRWTTDQCHPNPEGHRQIAARMLPIVSFALTQITTAPSAMTIDGGAGPLLNPSRPMSSE